MAPKFVRDGEQKNKFNSSSEDYLASRAAVCAFFDELFTHLGHTIEGNERPFPLSAEALYGISCVMREMSNGIFDVLES